MDVFVGRTANQVIRAVASNFCDPVVKWRGTGQGPDGGKGQVLQTTTATERQGEVRNRKSVTTYTCNNSTQEAEAGL